MALIISRSMIFRFLECTYWYLVWVWSYPDQCYEDYRNILTSIWFGFDHIQINVIRISGIYLPVSGIGLIISGSMSSRFGNTHLLFLLPPSGAVCVDAGCKRLAPVKEIIQFSSNIYRNIHMDTKICHFSVIYSVHITWCQKFDLEHLFSCGNMYIWTPKGAITV